MTAVVNKPWLDRQVAELLGKKTSEVSAITAAFLNEASRSLVGGARVRLGELGELHTYTRSGARGVFHSTKFRGEKTVVEVPVKYYVGFRKSAALATAMRLARPKENAMEKYAVDEGTDQETLEKQATQGCPVCGKTPTRHGKVLMCPEHGSEPFEQTKK